MNWNRHFQQSSNSRVTGSESVFGTINSEHTIHELSDLLNALQSQVDAMTQAYNSGHDAWQEADFTGFPAWETDWNTFLARWQPVADWTKGRVADGQKSGTAEQLNAAASLLLHPLASLGISGSNQPWDTITDEPAYQHLMTAFKPYDGDPTSFVELDRRWRASSSAPTPPDYSKTPQPTAPDADLNVYKTSDKVLKTMTSIMPPLPFGPPMPLWKKLAWGGAALVGLGIVIRVATGRII